MPYFDAASGLPPHPVARQAMLAALDEGWADPTRLHREGRRARLLLDAARESTAESLGCRPDEVVFAPSGTRALHTAVAGALTGRRRVGNRLLVSAVEHSAVLHAAEAHEAGGGRVYRLGVDREGRVLLEEVRDALAEEDGGAALLCLQSANHEVGTVQPLAEVASYCLDAGVPLLVDAAQTLAWQTPPAGWSLLTGSAHKWGGPAGVGLLAVRKGTRFAPTGPQDERERGWMPGAPGLPAIVAAAASLRAVRAESAGESERLRTLVDRIRTAVPQLVPDTEVVGHPRERLPHLVTFSCLYADGESLLHALDEAGFSVSSGSSCSSSTLTPSHVLRAMGVLSEGNVRVSLPPGTTGAEVDAFLAALPEAVRSVRARLDPPTGAADGAAVPDGTAVADGTAAPDGTAVADGTAAPDGAAAGAPAGLTVDALGRRCPIPVIELAKVIDRVPVGGIVTVLADDEAARLDIPAWCRMRGHRYLGSEGTTHRVAREQ
ncbi:cysteine desulfurase/sulfurtransferase TusA family protein [Streptomyces sp. XM4193]|uniref:cysteine desulfurase/sulfurtransferase TusA family protein n=1 Tax=Streptomyces sp. XM4193 TaxID=2929782 RepID=UPI001FFAB136|nr:cysteine desulfurase/sulfurtransferase TusA family protein [Streptomyces sp. XM4193]MCK1796296.1 cysteine desulfurase/sulfurtransferase TusA family protein [Streptomyces sp. XM4193]